MAENFKNSPITALLGFYLAFGTLFLAIGSGGVLRWGLLAFSAILLIPTLFWLVKAFINFLKNLAKTLLTLIDSSSEISSFKKSKVLESDLEIAKKEIKYWQDKFRVEEYAKRYWQELYNSISQSGGINKLSKKEMKIIYKKAANLCHPDKVKDKEKAHQIFSKLSNAYEKKDLVKMVEIYINLQVDRYELEDKKGEKAGF